MRLVRFGVEHIEATWGWLQDPSLRAAIDSLAAPTRAENEAYWRRRLDDPTRDDHAVIASRRHVGNGGLVLDRARGKAEVWLYLGSDRGAGIGRRAAELLLCRAFDDLELQRVYLRVLSTNRRAAAFWRSLGFVDEGRWRRDTLVAGMPADSLWLGMLSGERNHVVKDR